MKKKYTSETKDELCPEYDLQKLLSGGVRGKYVKLYSARTNVVLLDPDVSEAFPNEAAVNDALRLAIHLAEIQHPKKRSNILKNHRKTKKQAIAS